MGRPAARRLLLGPLVLSAALVGWLVLGWSSPSSAGVARTSVVTGAVDADGSGVLPAGWSVEHTDPGYYVVRAPASVANDLDVETWDGAAEVSVAPVGSGDVEVRFTSTADGRPVDVRFTWRSLVLEV